MKQFKDVPIVISKGSPYEIGFNHGSKAKDRILKSIKYNLPTCIQEGWFTKEDAVHVALDFMKPVREYNEAYLEELQGIADGSGLTFEEIMMLNCRTELQKHAAQMAKRKQTEFPEGDEEACTCMAVTGERMTDGSTYVVQNWDNRPWARECLIFHVIEQKDGKPAIAYVGEAGIISRFGMNSAGLGSGCNSLYSNSPVKLDGVPLQFLLRGVLDSTDLAMGMDACNRGQNGAVNNILIAYKDGDAADVEMDYECAGYLYPEDGILVHANMYVSPGHPRYPYVDTCAGNAFLRHHRANKLIRDIEGKISPEDLKRVMSDHGNAPQSICRHGEPWLSEERRIMTIFSYLCNLNSLKMELALGCPCGGYTSLKPFDWL